MCSSVSLSFDAALFRDWMVKKISEKLCLLFLFLSIKAEDAYPKSWEDLHLPGNKFERDMSLIVAKVHGRRDESGSFVKFS